MDEDLAQAAAWHIAYVMREATALQHLAGALEVLGLEGDVIEGAATFATLAADQMDDRLGAAVEPGTRKAEGRRSPLRRPITSS
jgi:hypothetical protein